MKLLRFILFAMLTLLLYLGLPLLGWGLDDLEAYFSFAPRLGYAAVVGLFSLAVGAQAFSSMEGIRGGKGEEDKFVFRQRVVRISLVLCLYLALFFVPYLDSHAIGVWDGGFILSWLGVVFSALGFTLVFWSGLVLGRQYSADVTIQKEHRLITSSIYRFIRHPRYLGIISLSLGFSLIFHSWIGLVASLGFLAVLIFRMNDEEAAMLKAFGLEWEAYCKRSWRLVPRIY